MNDKEHWEKVYREKDPTMDVSWFQAHPTSSLELIEATGIAKHEPLIDVGGGASSLVDHLLDAGFRNVAVLDISHTAIEHAQHRLASRAEAVSWFETDVTAFNLSRQFALWHDRAVFHFLTDQSARRDYVRTLKRALVSGGHVVIGTFAKDGPTRCSGLDVVRYDAGSICAQLGDEFGLMEQHGETHVTPWNAKQQFTWFRFQRKPFASMHKVSALPSTVKSRRSQELQQYH